MSKQKTYEVLHASDNCPNCTQPMQRREHKKLKEKQINAPYYFSEWDYCTGCNHLQHYERFKVFNSNKSAALYKSHGSNLNQMQQQMDFLKSI